MADVSSDTVCSENPPIAKKPRLQSTEETIQKGPTKNNHEEECTQPQMSPTDEVFSGSSDLTSGEITSNSTYDGDCQRESDVGITEYISSHEGFSAIIKQRVSDFHVREIDLAGIVLQLTDVDPPKCDQLQVKTEEEVEPLPEDWSARLKELCASDVANAEVQFEIGDCDKDERRRLHKALKSAHSDLEARTEDSSNGRVIVVSKNKSGNRRQRIGQDHDEYTRFIMYKENKDTMEAVNLMCSYIRLKPRLLQYAGTKDRRGKTTQQMSIRRVDATRLHKLNDVLRGITLGNFSYCKEALKLGDLNGNEFTVVLRNVTGSTEQVLQAVSSLKQSGFINYFGMQRFGTTSIPTHHIGRHVLKSNWKDVVELILKPRPGRHDRLNAARDIWWKTRNASKALDALGRQNCIERQLLTGLKTYNQNDLVSAINNIPRNGRLLYLHSYQSFVWNMITSRRLREHGLKLMCGDLVMPDKANLIKHTEGSKRHEQKIKMEPIFVTEENLESYSIHDLVLPLPGHSILYPDNEVKKWYTEVLATDGLTLESFTHKIRDYSLPGDYRPLVIRPEEVTSRETMYDDFTIPLALSDYEKLTDNTPPQNRTEGKYKAVILKFRLPSSTYATMALREILKTDTSSAHQATLNVT